MSDSEAQDRGHFNCLAKVKERQKGNIQITYPEYMNRAISCLTEVTQILVAGGRGNVEGKADGNDVGNDVEPLENVNRAPVVSGHCPLRAYDPPFLYPKLFAPILLGTFFLALYYLKLRYLVKFEQIDRKTLVRHHLAQH